MRYNTQVLYKAALRYSMNWMVGLTQIKSLDGMDSELLENHVI